MWTHLHRNCFPERTTTILLPRSPLATRFQTPFALLRSPPSASLALFKLTPTAAAVGPLACRSFFSASSSTMGSVGPYQRKHKLAVVGSGNW